MYKIAYSCGVYCGIWIKRTAFPDSNIYEEKNILLCKILIKIFYFKIVQTKQLFSDSKSEYASLLNKAKNIFIWHISTEFVIHSFNHI